eukprot:2580841-Pleurochrysis_carterae.AAC.1
MVGARMIFQVLRVSRRAEGGLGSMEAARTTPTAATDGFESAWRCWRRRAAALPAPAYHAGAAGQHGGVL